MDEEESPLDVLSRAATMVSPPTYDEARTYANKDMPTGKWRRERRSAVNNKTSDTPLDFSTRRGAAQSGLRPPPSYDQTIQNKMYENGKRPSVIQSAGPASAATSKNTQLSDDACDPAIDEHFRRSLGKDYSSIFSKNDQLVPKQDTTDVDATSLSVDDHFAKALGETWTKLKAKEHKNKGNNNNNNHITNIKSRAAPQSDGVNIRKKKKTASTESILNDKRRAVVTST